MPVAAQIESVSLDGSVSTKGNVETVKTRLETGATTLGEYGGVRIAHSVSDLFKSTQRTILGPDGEPKHTVIRGTHVHAESFGIATPANGGQIFAETETTRSKFVSIEDASGTRTVITHGPRTKLITVDI